MAEERTIASPNTAALESIRIWVDISEGGGIEGVLVVTDRSRCGLLQREWTQIGLLRIECRGVSDQYTWVMVCDRPCGDSSVG